MVHKMPGQLSSLKHRKRKSVSKKTSATRRKCMKSPKTQPAAEGVPALHVCGDADGPLETLSHITCECLQSADRRCSASPELRGQEGKENEPRTRLDPDSCGVNGKEESEDMDCEESNKNIFPDDDSNQILPVEQFFGNLDAVQDFPQRPSTTSSRAHREHRRRHYYAPEDSDEEESVLQRDEEVDT